MRLAKSPAQYVKNISYSNLSQKVLAFRHGTHLLWLFFIEIYVVLFLSHIKNNTILTSKEKQNKIIYVSSFIEKKENIDLPL